MSNFNMTILNEAMNAGKELVAINQPLTSTVIDKIMKDHTVVEMSKEERYASSAVYTTIKLVQMMTGLNEVVSIANAAARGGEWSMEDQIYYDRFCGWLYANLGRKNANGWAVHGSWCEGKFLNVYMQIFGGKIGNTVVQKVQHLEEIAPQASVLGEAGDLECLRNSVYAHAHAVEGDKLETLKALEPVKFDKDFVSIRLDLNSKVAEYVTMTWSDFAKKAKLVRQVVMVTCRNDNRGNMVASHAEGLSVFQRIAIIHKSGIELSGLIADRNVYAVVNLGKSMSFKTMDPKVVKVPFKGMIADGKVESETIAIGEMLTKEGKWGPVLNAEQFQRQGYVQLLSKYITEENAFCDKEGNSFEDLAKLLARLQKLVNNKSAYLFDADNYIIAAANESVAKLEAATDASIKWKKDIQQQFSYELSLSFVAGNDIATPRLSNKVGVGRIVSGKDVNASGQKAMLGTWKRMVTEELKAVAAALPDFLASEAMLSGISSTKSTAVSKGVDGWELRSTEYKKHTVFFWVKTNYQETFQITDSATTGAWECVVSEKTTGIDAAVDLFKRRILGHKSYSVMDMVYGEKGMNSGLTIVERILRLEKAGKIKRKAIGTYTNSQLNEGLMFQFGEDFAKEVLEFLITQNKAITYRDTVKAGKDCQDGNVADKAIIDGVQLIKTVAEYMLELGDVNVETSVWSSHIVKELVDTLAAPNTNVVALDFAGKQVLVPVTNATLAAIEETTRPGYVRVSGMMGEILLAMGHAVKTAMNKATMVNDVPSAHAYTMSEKAGAVVAEKLAKARDRQFGKQLNRIPVIGTNVFLLTSARLKDNEMMSYIVEEAYRLAEEAYNCKVGGLYTKSPTLWKASISGVKMIPSMEDAFEAIIEGVAAYISPEKALGNGNDADGDRQLIILIAAWLLAKVKELQPDFYWDARDSYVAAGGPFYAEFWEDEVAKCTYAPKVQEVKVTAATFKADMQQAVFQAAYAKANVARFTSFGQINMLRHVTWKEAAVNEINRMKFAKLNKEQRKELDLDSMDVEAVAQALWVFNMDVQYACVNFDAMDQVKSMKGRDMKKLAELLAPSSLSYLDPMFASATDDKNAKEVATAKTIKRIEEVSTMMFGENGYNISYDQIRNLFPVLASEVAIQQFIVSVLVKSGTATGVEHRITYCPWNLLATDIKDEHTTMSTILEERSERTYTDSDGVERQCVKKPVESITKFILETAIEFVGYKYQSIQD